jgi:bifunctional enzyme CysN/CysC
MDDAVSLARQGDLLEVVVVGHVDHGKSTLVGRMLNDTHSLPEGRVEAVKAQSEARGMPFEWAFVTDALQAERDQGITIDASYIRFKSAIRDYLFIDAPGHRDFLRNMVTGAADCDAALVVIDSLEGVRDQSRRHGYLLSLLGVKQVAVAVTKMDLVDYSESRFAEIESAFRAVLGELGVHPSAIVPVASREGGNLVARSDKMRWYRGPTVIEALDGFTGREGLDRLPLRMPVQDVYKFDARRIVAGRIESGRLRVGDEVLFSPSNRRARVASIESFGARSPVLEAEAGRSTGFTLDEQIFVERGEMVSHVAAPPIESNVFRARLFWLGATPLMVGKGYTLKLNTVESAVEVAAVERVIDTARMAPEEREDVPQHAVADVVLRTPTMMALDRARDNPRTGRFVLVDGYDVVGGGLIDMEGYPDQREAITRRSTNVTEVVHRITADMRASRNGHRGGVLWFTGLSGAGKTTIAVEIEHRLFDEGYQIVALDGDDLRHGLNANLGFSPQDRAENVRRVGEVAALFAKQGFIVVTSLISPYRADRIRARAAAPEDSFEEIYVQADVATCESRDVKGLYAKARAGQIRDFTGISAPYEAPHDCELVVDTSRQSIEQSVQTVLDHVHARYPLANRKG